MTLAIVWHSADLRTDWNPALAAAAKEHDKVLPLYIPIEEDLGGASLWWLHEALQDLNEQYKKRGSALCIRKGDPVALFKTLGADAVYWNIRFEPEPFSLQSKVAKALEKEGISCQIFNGNHLIDPREIEVKPGKPYSIFTPFYKACLKEIEVPKEPKIPSKLSSPKCKSDPLPFKENKWMHKLEKHWIPKRAEGLKHLHQFVQSHLRAYTQDRDFPAIKGTSRLSPYLHFGQICPHEVWHKTNEPYRRQLLWREFGTYFIYHFPKSRKHNWNQKFDKFHWDKSPSKLKKWTQGETGYPIIDAAMRELWETGWMHNRLRMIVASFLTKDLFINWTEGEKWFWDTLVDADLGNNILGWQWTAGSGPDAAPYFRIFNPILQGEKFDPDGEFIRTYLPQLKNLPAKWIHHPWDAPPEELEKAHITLGKDYPLPIVDHSKSRKEALKRFDKIK